MKKKDIKNEVSRREEKSFFNLHVKKQGGNAFQASCTYVATAPKVTCQIPAGIMGLSSRNSEIKYNGNEAENTCCQVQSE